VILTELLPQLQHPTNAMIRLSVITVLQSILSLTTSFDVYIHMNSELSFSCFV
jgi:hypothetical protein